MLLRTISSTIDNQAWTTIWKRYPRSKTTFPVWIVHRTATTSRQLPHMLTRLTWGSTTPTKTNSTPGNSKIQPWTQIQQPTISRLREAQVIDRTTGLNLSQATTAHLTSSKQFIQLKALQFNDINRFLFNSRTKTTISLRQRLSQEDRSDKHRLKDLDLSLSFQRATLNSRLSSGMQVDWSNAEIAVGRSMSRLIRNTWKFARKSSWWNGSSSIYRSIDRRRMRQVKDLIMIRGVGNREQSSSL